MSKIHGQFLRFVLMLSFITIIASHIYDTSPAFYSQRCYVGAKTTSTFSCALTTAQTGVIRIGLAMSQYDKNQWSYWSFQVTTSTPVGSVSSVSISLTDIEPKKSNPGYVNEFGFFVVCIKSQPTTKYVDLLLYSCPSSTLMDNRNTGDRSVPQSIALSGNTIFTSGTGLTVVPFTTSFKVDAKYSSGTTRDWYFIMSYVFTAVINGNNVDVTLTAKSQTKLSGFKGIIIVFDPVTTTATTPVQISSKHVILNAYWHWTQTIATTFPDFGPNFDGKCVFGFHTLAFAGGVPMIHDLKNNTFSHYYKFALSTWGSGCEMQVSGFCFGADNSTLCGDQQNFTDPLDSQCYRAATCPLPVPTGWTSWSPAPAAPGICPMCRQIICKSCPITNRSDCQDCGPNAVLTSGVCSCQTPNFIPITKSISTSAQGLWNGYTPSLHDCKINCTYHIVNCGQTTCTSTTFCTGCQSGYAVDYVDATNQGCKLCSLFMAGCQTCSSPTVCSTCTTGNYFDGTNCVPCISPCNGCSDATTCTSCVPSYTYASGTCTCDPPSHGLANCATCSSSTVCTGCTSNSFYLSTVDNKCHSCTSIHAQCLTCSDSITCLTCGSSYTPSMVGSIQTCTLCSSHMLNCDTCSSISVCTACLSGYYPTGSTCTSCNSLVPGCGTCTSSACGTCSTGYQISWSSAIGVCTCTISLTTLTNCASCTIPTQCTACTSNSYYLKSSNSLCYSCSTIHSQCQTCSNENTCSTCASTNYITSMVGSIQTCTLCSSHINNCNTCSSTTVCITCFTGYYVSSGGVSCIACSTIAIGCLTCSSAPACTGCDTGYILGSGTCTCDVSYTPLNNCATCTILSECTACVSTAFYLSTSDHLCHSCSTIHASCVACSDFNTCTSCTLPFIVWTFGNRTKGCALCTPFVSDCTTCYLDPNICTDCNFLYGLTPTSQCQRCNTLLNQPECQSCEDNSACLSCNIGSALIYGVCHYCNALIPKCTICSYDYSISQTICGQCQNGYIPILNTALGIYQCKTCGGFMNFCTSCSSSSVCTACQSPYAVGPDGTCSSCQPDYQFFSGYCTKISGCISLYIKPDGTEVCLACAQPLNFAYNPIHMNCECAKGYKAFSQINQLTQCLPVCGDGIIASGDEQCDDKNTNSKDGCSDKCKIEQNFVCSTSQPSKCVLYFNFNVFTFNHVYRVLGENKGIMSFTIFPKHEGLERMNWVQLLKLNFTQDTVDPSSLSYSYNVETGELQVTVPYNEELQNSVLQAEISFNPNMIVSLPDKITIANKLNGVNAPLIFESSLMLSTYKNISLISLIMALLLLLQFYVGSYFHKMIGLETIQVIQAVYFARMLSKSSSSSLLSSMNVLEYSATGYENAHLLYGDLTDIQNHAYTVMDREFLEIGMKSFYLLNVNLSLLPIVIVITVYIVSFARKAIMRNLYIETREQEKKDRYTMLRRSCQWVYDHFVFPSTMLFSLISFFYTILELTKHDPKDSQSEVTSPQQLEVSSFSVHLIVLFMTTGIYCFEVFASYSEYVRYKMTPEEKQKIPESMVQKLEHDENYLDRANYHPLYVLVYLLYYFLLSLVMIFSALVESFTYTLEVTLGLSVAYFLVICIWKPYHISVNIHNHLLKLYYLTFVLFLVIEYLMTKSIKLPLNLHVVLMYIIMGLLGCIFAVGMIRIWLQKQFKVALSLDNDLLNWGNNGQEANKNTFQQGQNKKLSLMLNNQYLFDNQLHRMKNRLNRNQTIEEKNIELPPEEKEFLINKIRQQTALKRQNILENLLKENLKKPSSNFAPSLFEEPSIMSSSSKFNKDLSEDTKSNKSLTEENSNENESLEILKRKLRKQWRAINR